MVVRAFLCLFSKQKPLAVKEEKKIWMLTQANQIFCMPIIRTILFPVGSKLEIYSDGKRKYVPSPAYIKTRQEFMRKPDFKHKPASSIKDDINCFRLLAAAFGYSVPKQKSLFKESPKVEALPYMSIWKD